MAFPAQRSATHETERLDDVGLRTTDSDLLVINIDRRELNRASCGLQNLIGSLSNEETVLALVDLEGRGGRGALLKKRKEGGKRSMSF